MAHAFAPDWRVHPGETLTEILEERGMTQAELGEACGTTQTQISYVCNGKRPMRAWLAVALEQALGGPTAEFWMAMQTNHDLHEAREARR